MFFPYIVGLTESNGYFLMKKKGKYITYEFGIELSIRDVQLIYKIKKILGVGTVSFENKYGLNKVYLKIKDKNDLKNLIIPIFDKYPMFSNKQYDYLIFRDSLISGIIYSQDLVKYTISNEPINRINYIISSNHFPVWLVGYIEANCCFSLFLDNDYLVACFSIEQKDDDILIYAIREYLSFSNTIYLDKLNCSKLKVTEIRCIKNVIKFLKNAPQNLLGYKKLQYILWKKQLYKINRYSKNF